MRIREAQKHADSTDPDPQHCFKHLKICTLQATVGYRKKPYYSKYAGTVRNVSNSQKMSGEHSLMYNQRLSFHFESCKLSLLLVFLCLISIRFNHHIISASRLRVRNRGFSYHFVHLLKQLCQLDTVRYRTNCSMVLPSYF